MCANFSKNFPFLFLTCSKMPLKIKKVYINKDYQKSGEFADRGASLKKGFYSA
jgi:hypothetical protein